MIRDPALLHKFEDSFIKNDTISFNKAMRLFIGLYNEAKTLGIFPPEKPLDGIEVDLRIARIINSCLRNSSQD